MRWGRALQSFEFFRSHFGLRVSVRVPRMSAQAKFDWNPTV
jgi:hypothetical protein